MTVDAQGSGYFHIIIASNELLPIYNKYDILCSGPYTWKKSSGFVLPGMTVDAQVLVN